MRALGYWLLYATVGALVVLMAIGGGGDLGSEDAKSPIRHRTKVMGAISGICLAVTAFGAYLLNDAEATKTWAWVMVGVCGPAAAVLSIWTFVRIVNDLNRRSSSRAAS